MLKCTVVRKDKDKLLQIVLEGNVDEKIDFDKLIFDGQHPLPKELMINCSGILRINSNGVNLWIHYFQGLNKKGTHLTFLECSHVIVQHLNYFKNFHANGSIESIQIPYYCEACDVTTHSIFSTTDLSKIPESIPNVECPQCNKLTAEFDDIIEDFFGFIHHTAVR